MCIVAEPKVIGGVVCIQSFFNYSGFSQMFQTDGIWTFISLMIFQEVCIAAKFKHLHIPTTARTEEVQVVPDGTMQTSLYSCRKM